MASLDIRNIYTSTKNLTRDFKSFLLVTQFLVFNYVLQDSIKFLYN